RAARDSHRRPGRPVRPGPHLGRDTRMKNVVVCTDPAVAGERAARAAGGALRSALGSRGTARAIFASAPSQSRMLAALGTDESLDWTAVQSFHMDEYLGIDMNHPQTFGRWLEQHLPGTALATFNRIRTNGT